VVDRPEVAAGLWDRVVDEVTTLSDADWTRDTALPGWRVADLVGHLSGIQVFFDSGTVEQPPDGWEPPAGASPLDAWAEAAVAARREWLREQVVTELAHARNGHVSRLAEVEDWDAPTPGPVGETTEAGLFAVRMFDVWVHLQDLRMAVGRDVEVQDISQAAAIAHRYVWDRVPWLYGKRVGAPEGSSLRLAFGPPLDEETTVVLRDGRGRFDRAVDAGDCAVTGAPAALTLLVTGRGDAQRWRDAGLLDWSGDRGEEFVQRARLF
jgi:uncharacterized protein (TIGR03083 family)